MAKYKVSDMLYHNESKGFLCQSSPCSSSSGKEGCPCALLSVWNYLVLEHGVPCQSNDGYKTEKDICNTLSRKLIEGFNKLKRAGCFGQDSDQMQRKILASMRSLPTGIKLNPAFNSIEDFEMSTATLLFAALGIPLIHGHVIDPKTLSDPSSSNASNQGQAASNEPMNSVALFKTQLTNYGLTRLLRGQKEGELAVLYTNGHYSTTLKKENIMLTLETNEDVLRNAPDAIWRRLTVLDGDSFYLTSRFSPTKSQRNKEKADQWYNQNLKEKFGISEDIHGTSKQHVKKDRSTKRRLDIDQGGSASMDGNSFPTPADLPMVTEEGHVPPKVIDKEAEPKVIDKEAEPSKVTDQFLDFLME